jgi:hypothetical protein
MPMPTFTPSGEDREQVATLSSAGVSLEEIAKGIVNPRTGRPINPRTLQKVFKQELQENLALKKLIIERYKAAVEQNAAWATLPAAKSRRRRKSCIRRRTSASTSGQVSDREMQRMMRIHGSTNPG